MRLVLISDTHNKTANLKVPDGDILVHAGDLTMSGKLREVKIAGDWLNSLPHKYKIVIAGNHDFLFETDPIIAQALLGPKITYLENSGAEIEGLKFWGSPIQPWFYNWAFNRARGDEIRKYWDMIPEGLGVLITHGPPRGILDQPAPHISESEHCGCDDLREAVHRVKPRIHVFGHIHGGYGWRPHKDTTFYNASVLDEAYNLRNEPWMIDFDRKRIRDS